MTMHRVVFGCCGREVSFLLGLFCLCAAIYWKGLSGPLILDDFPHLNIYFSSEVLTDGDLQSRLISSSGQLGRMFPMLSFTLDYYICGNDIKCWKLTNLIIHLLCGGFIFLLSKTIISTLSAVTPKNKYLPLIISAVWLLHPLQVSTVLYLVQRMAQLSTLFVLTGLYIYAIARTRQIKTGKADRSLWVTIPLLTLMAALSKENGILLLPLILVMELFIFKLSGPPETGKITKAFLLIVIILPLLIGLVYLVSRLDYYVLSAYNGRPFTLGERLLTETRVLVKYLFQIIIPDPRSMTFFYDNLEISRGFFKPASTFTSILFLAAIIILAWLKRNTMPLFSFGIAFFLVAHSMESSLFALELVFEHRNYLPLWGIIIAIIGMADLKPQSTAIRDIAAGVIIISFSLLTLIRVDIWSSPTNLYNYIYKHNPESVRIRTILAEELTRQHRYDAAISHLEGVKNNGAILQRMYIKCRKENYLDDKEFKILGHLPSRIVDDYMITGIIELSNLGIDEKCTFNKILFLDFIKKLDTFTHRSVEDQSKIVVYEAHYHWNYGNKNDAFPTLDKASRLNVSDPVPLFLAAEWALETGEPEKAREYFGRASGIAGSKTKYEKLMIRVSKLINDYNSHER